MAEEEAERKRTTESMISDGDTGAANDFHLIAPPTLLESGKGERVEDERERENLFALKLLVLFVSVFSPSFPRPIFFP